MGLAGKQAISAFKHIQVLLGGKVCPAMQYCIWKAGSQILQLSGLHTPCHQQIMSTPIIYADLTENQQPTDTYMHKLLLAHSSKMINNVD